MLPSNYVYDHRINIGILYPIHIIEKHNSVLIIREEQVIGNMKLEI